MLLPYDGADLLTSLVSVKEAVRAIPNKGLGYGLFFGYGSRDLPRVTFNYLGQFDTAKAADAESADLTWKIVDEDV